MLKKSLFTVIVLVLIKASFAQIKLTDPIPIDPSVTIGKLSNGVSYYIRKNTMPAKKVELRLAVNAGSVLENDNQQGLAHFMEHMGFNGSKNFPKNELVDFLQKSGVKFGADLNAYTSFDETVYILPVPVEDPTMLDKGFTVLEDWAFNNLFDKNEIEKERGVVLEESRLGKGADERMRKVYFPRLFNGSKYANRLPIGKDDVLKTFKPQDLINFYKTWYRPNNMAVAVVGDIDPAEVKKMIEKHFGTYKNPAKATARPAIIPIKERTAPEALVLTDDEQTNTVLQIYNFVKPSPKQATWGDYKKNIVEGLVSSLINQRLNELTQSENPPFMFGFTGFGGFLRGYSSFNSFAVLGKGGLQNAIDALITETNRAKQFGFLQSELDRAKASMLTGAEKAFKEKDKSQSGQIVMQYVSHFLSGNPIPGVENRLNFMKDILPSITVKDVNDVARSMPLGGNAFVMVQAPSSMKEQLPTQQKVLDDIATAGKIPVKAYEEKAVAKSLMDKAPVAGKVVSENKNEALGTTNLMLSNGVTVSIKPTTFKNDEIQLDAWRLGGAHQYGLDDKENASQASQIVQQMGVKDMTPTDLRKFLAGKTLNVMPYINTDEEGIEGTCSVKDFETFLQLINLYFTSPRRDEKLFNSYVTKQKGFVENIEKDPEASFSDTLEKIAYSNNPWVSGIPRASDFDKLKLDRVMQIYKDVFSNADGLQFTFIGNIDPVAAKPLIEKYIGSLPASKVAHNSKDVGIRLKQGVTDVVMKRGKESQAMINIMMEGEMPYTRENRLQLAALIEVLNIEIIEKLREDMSGIYGGGLSGSLQKRPYEHYSISGRIPCGPDNVEKLTNALTGLIKEAQEKGISQKNLDKVKETWKKQYHVNMQNNGYWLSGLSNAFINGTNPDDILTYEKAVDAITVQDVQNAAKKYLTLNNMVKAVMMPESSPVKEEVKTTKGF